MSFGWIFALIAGAVIIFLAIYFTAKLGQTQQELRSAEVGKEIGILLNPLETSFESAQTSSIVIPSETRIHNGCDNSIGNFGKQTIQLEQKNFGKWSKTDIDVSFRNKYIFSDSEVEGKKFYLFSKPLYFPFKIADLFYMTSANERYCFMNAPYDIESEVLDLNQSNLITDNCTSNDIKVCFNSKRCDINVDYGSGIVEKDGEEMYFTEASGESKVLMYAAIFSNKEVYECQLSRLMMRLKELSQLYSEKEILDFNKGCNGNLRPDLTELGDMASSFDSSEQIEEVKIKADIIEERNNGAMCMLW